MIEGINISNAIYRLDETIRPLVTILEQIVEDNRKELGEFLQMGEHLKSISGTLDMIDGRLMEISTHLDNIDTTLMDK
jgi:hypothetical protein